MRKLIFNNICSEEIGIIVVEGPPETLAQEEYEEIAERFPDGVPLFYMFDEDNILEEHESPSDNPTKWQRLVDNNIYRLR